MILDLGCGTSKKTGAIGMDNVSLPGVDIVHDLLDFPYPFEDNSADEIHLNHVIEHFSLPDILKILGETYRIIKPEKSLYICVPHIYSIAAWSDPTHRMAFTFISGAFFDKASEKSYYKELDSRWVLSSTSAKATIFNWKKYRLRKIDSWFSNRFASFVNWLLKQKDFPGSADIFIKATPAFFVEIEWQLRKPEA